MPTLERWKATWRGLGVDGDEPLYRSLIERYAEPHRSYHTTQHLDECFARLDESTDRAIHPFEVELALWFHDAVYDTRSQENEERSASWAESAIQSAGLSAVCASRIRDLIMATKHAAMSETKDAKLLVDVDLAILARPYVFSTDYFRATYEAQARANLERSVKTLGG